MDKQAVEADIIKRDKVTCSHNRGLSANRCYFMGIKWNN